MPIGVQTLGMIKKVTDKNINNIPGLIEITKMILCRTAHLLRKITLGWNDKIVVLKKTTTALF